MIRSEYLSILFKVPIVRELRERGTIRISFGPFSRVADSKDPYILGPLPALENAPENVVPEPIASVYSVLQDSILAPLFMMMFPEWCRNRLEPSIQQRKAGRVLGLDKFTDI